MPLFQITERRRAFPRRPLLSASLVRSHVLPLLWQVDTRKWKHGCLAQGCIGGGGGGGERGFVLGLVNAFHLASEHEASPRAEVALSTPSFLLPSFLPGQLHLPRGGHTVQASEAGPLTPHPVPAERGGHYQQLPRRQVFGAHQCAAVRGTLEPALALALLFRTAIDSGGKKAAGKIQTCFRSDFFAFLSFESPQKKKKGGELVKERTGGHRSDPLKALAQSVRTLHTEARLELRARQPDFASLRGKGRHPAPNRHRLLHRHSKGNFQRNYFTSFFISRGGLNQFPEQKTCRGQVTAKHTEGVVEPTWAKISGYIYMGDSLPGLGHAGRTLQ